jgi:hypothetical protein
MKGNQKDAKNEAMRMELKYCEHCGGLWFRERGAGVVYCDNCRPIVADLPLPKKKPERVKIPVRPHALVEDYGFEPGDDELDFEAAGGAA